MTKLFESVLLILILSRPAPEGHNKVLRRMNASTNSWFSPYSVRMLQSESLHYSLFLGRRDGEETKNDEKGGKIKLKRRRREERKRCIRSQKSRRRRETTLRRRRRG